MMHLIDILQSYAKYWGGLFADSYSTHTTTIIVARSSVCHSLLVAGSFSCFTYNSTACPTHV
jgi:hypothetical protein